MSSNRGYEPYKPKNQSIKFEDLILHKNYAISFNPESQPGIEAKNIMPWLHHLFKGMNGYVEGCYMILHPEYSQLGRLHFHGIVTINDYVLWAQTLRKLILLGTVHITEIKTIPEWSIYCEKQKSIFEPLYKKNKRNYPEVVRQKINFAPTDIRSEVGGPLEKYLGEPALGPTGPRTDSI